eukprot:TRINITY_DN24673_c0_g1_i1.p1 TRINITY_DN24673_c0_g1~~TRINITY_DN24673_c0_g1_i1.p1  ORF type:complete len:537 (-),score=106.53 TRINITY_DN24673_c0_g1_i1:22-1632(-)
MLQNLSVRLLRWSILVAALPDAALAGVDDAAAVDRQLPLVPSPDALFPGTPCLEVLLSTGKWQGNERWGRGGTDAYKTAQASVTSEFGLMDNSWHMQEVLQDKIAETMQRVTRRAMTLASRAASVVAEVLLALEGLRQFVRMHRYTGCMQQPSENADRLCHYLTGDLSEVIGCVGDCEKFDFCKSTEHFEDLLAVIDALWHRFRSVSDVVPQSSSDWMLPARYPAEYSRGICPKMVQKDAFEGQLPQSVDPLGVPSWHLSMAQIMQRLQSFDVPLSHRLVNLGAHNGSCSEGTEYHDPANCLLRSGDWTGLLFEGDASNIEKLEQAFRGLDSAVAVVNGWLGLENLSSILQEAMGAHALTPDIDLLKIDLDLCDDLVLQEALAAGLRPKIVHVEVQLVFPPGVVYRVRPQGSYHYDSAVTRMVPSLSAYTTIPGYKLLHIDGYNAVLLREDLTRYFPTTLRSEWEIWRDHYYCRGDMPALVAATQGLQGGYKFGDFDFRAFLDGPNLINKVVIEVYVVAVSNSLPEGITPELGYID